MNRMIWVVCGVILTIAPAARSQEAKFARKPVLTLSIAKRLAAAVLKAACMSPLPAGERPVVKNGVDGDCIGSVAIADDAGVVFYLETLDGTQAPSVEMAIKKARTAALWKRSTDTFHQAIQSGKNMSYLDGSFPMTTAPGGEPLYFDKECVGGIGFSGQDPAKVMSAYEREWQAITGGK